MDCQEVVHSPDRSKFQTDMANNPKLKLVTFAIEKLMEENKNDEASENGDDRLLLSRLLSQVELLEGEELLEEQREGSSVSGSAESEEIAFAIAADEQTEAATKGASGEVDIGKDEIMKELKKLRKQNFVTHCLLSAMIVLTVAWHLSEVTLVLKVKNSLSHPFQTFGGLLREILKRPQIQEEDESSSSSKQNQKQNQSEAPAIALPPLKLPEIPNVQLPDLLFDAEKH